MSDPHEKLKDQLLAAVEGRQLDEVEIDTELKSLADAAKATPPNFLKSAWSFTNPMEAHGKSVGPFEIVEVLGRGGMGVVFRGRQTNPIHREVAVKIIRPELFTQAGKARFDVERSVLGRLCHSNIAKILETGSSENDQPYIAMELVPGPPVTDYSQQNRLALTQRLELFLEMCSGISHAHARGVIHRDLKPSNILVVEEEGKPVPKIIDFGIARAVDGGLTQRLTLTDQVLGTLEYVSPEVIEGGAISADVRSDIYALGAILYELVTGSPPVCLDEMGDRGLMKLLQRAKEAVIVRPSTLIQDQPDKSGVEATELGDLNCLILHALERDPDDRYQSVAALAADVNRFLRREPLTASPPSHWRNFQLSLRRNWVPVATTLAITLALATGFAVSWFKFQESERSKATALLAQRQAEDTIELLRDSALASHQQSHQAKAGIVRLGARAEKLLAGANLASPKTEFELLILLGHSYDACGRFDDAERTLKRAYELSEMDWAGPHEKSLASLKMAEHERGQQRPRKAIQFSQDAINFANSSGDAQQLGQAQYMLAISLLENGEVDEAGEMLSKMLEQEEIAGTVEPEIARARVQMMYAFILLQQKKPEEGLSFAKESYDTYKKIHGMSYHRTLKAGHNLAILLGVTNQKDKSLEIFEEVLPMREAILGKDHPDALLTKVMLALNLAELGQTKRAETLYREALHVGDEKYEDRNPVGPQAAAGLANIGMARNDFESAIEFSKKGVRYAKARFGENAWKVEIYRSRLAKFYLRSGDADQAFKIATEAQEVLAKSLGEQHPYSIRAADTADRASELLSKN